MLANTVHFLEIEGILVETRGAHTQQGEISREKIANLNLFFSLKHYVLCTSL